ncbi:MAG: outer membrane lipoprotein-sorting protein [Myxococcota bacterium]
MRPGGFRRFGPFLCAGAVLGLAGSAPGEKIEVPTAQEIEDALPLGGTLTGREIYERFLENKLHSAVQHLTVISSDPGGNDQQTRFWVRWKDYRESKENGDGDVPEGILAKTLVKFIEPFDMRYTGYLMILREDRESDQFVYSPSSRRIRRVNLRQASLMGTDYSFADIAYQDIEDGEYRRLPDEMIDSVPVYVVETLVKPFVHSPYYRTLVYLEKEHYIPLRIRYWDRAKVEIKEMKSEASSIREFDGVWVATHSSMLNLLEGTSSTLLIEKLEPNPDIADQLFSVFRLELRR